METFAFKTPDGDFIRQRAAALNTSVSEFLRDVVAALKPKQRARMVRKNGHYVAVLPPGSPPITDELIRAAEDEDDTLEAGK